MQVTLAVVALAALAASAAAATPGSRETQHYIIHTAPVAVPLFDIPIDPNLNLPVVEQSSLQLPGFKAEASGPAALPPTRSALIPAAFSSLTLLAFGSILIVSKRNLRRVGGRHRGSRRYVTRPMAYL